MDKRKIIHELIDKLLDIEEATPRGVDFEYSTHLGIRFNVTSRPKNYMDRVRPIYRDYEVSEESFLKAIEEIRAINETPAKEPEFSFTLPESKAKELGLIA